MIKAILWDVDGTLAETERDGHLKAFNQAFEALGLPWRWSEQRYAELLAVAGIAFIQELPAIRGPYQLESTSRRDPHFLAGTWVGLHIHLISSGLV